MRATVTGVTLRLTVDRSAWLEHVRATAAAYGPGLVPVVKGNGYGFGRPVLHEMAATLAPAVCVGSVHELADAPTRGDVVVLTPTLHRPERVDAILTVGDPAHVRALAGSGHRVIVKLGGSMHRYGVAPAGLPALLDAVHGAGLQPVAFGLHLPLAGADDDRVAEVEAWLPRLPPLPVWLSHLQPGTIAALRERHADRELAVRVGTRLWHGLPRGEFLRLSADVLATSAVAAGEPAGYRLTPAPADGTVVCIGTGSAAGVALLDVDDPARRSPFHFARTRLQVLEKPHMHTTMCFVPAGAPCPAVGDVVDVQQPLINVAPDEIDWRP